MTTRLRQRWLLAVLVAGQFMANVDIAIVNVATPSIHRELHASGGALEFIVSGYVLAFAMLIITGDPGISCRDPAASSGNQSLAPSRDGRRG
jgi:MFS family permease